MQRLRADGGAGAVGSASLSEQQQQEEAVLVASLRADLAAALTENADMRAELNAFDPAFFDEIEQMKEEHHALGNKVSE
jgi:hydroxyethylthiazole kinase-like sugar kinase family protein